MTSSKDLASGKRGPSNVQRPSSVWTKTGFGAAAANVVLPMPAAPWIRIRGADSTVVDFRIDAVCVDGSSTSTRR